jgi:hypothetical protein
MILKHGTTYTLTDEEQLQLKNMAETICNQKREFFVNNFKVDKSMSLYDMNLNGFSAELAFCRLCGIEFDSATVEEENHFTKVDCTLTDGRTVDVKTTIYLSGKLLAGKWKSKTSVDIFVLMIGKFPTFTFRGWANYNQLMNDSTLKNLGKGEGHCLSQEELNKDLEINNN